MKIKHLLLVALTALALGLASIGVIAPAIAGGRGGMTGEFGVPALAGGRGGLGGEVHALAGGNGGVNGGDVYSVAASASGAGGDISR
jgi:hypothetical protein